MTAIFDTACLGYCGCHCSQQTQRARQGSPASLLMPGCWGPRFGHLGVERSTRDATATEAAGGCRAPGLESLSVFAVLRKFAISAMTSGTQLLEDPLRCKVRSSGTGQSIPPRLPPSMSQTRNPPRFAAQRRQHARRWFCQPGCQSR